MFYPIPVVFSWGVLCPPSQQWMFGNVCRYFDVTTGCIVGVDFVGSTVIEARDVA